MRTLLSLLLIVPVTLASILSPTATPTPAPVPFLSPRSRDLISLIKRQAASAPAFPEQCQTTCAYFVSVYTACTTNQTASCLAVCSTPNLNSLVVCVNCAYKAYEDVSYDQWKTLYGSIQAIEITCADAGRSVTATEQWEQWTPYGSSTVSSSASFSSFSAGPSPSPTPPSSTTSKSTPIGAIVGGVVGGIAFLALIAILLLYLRRRRRRRDLDDRPVIQRQRSEPEGPKFDIDSSNPEMISPYTAAPFGSPTSTSPYDRPMPAIPDFPLENPHALPPGAGAGAGAGAKVQPSLQAEDDVVEYRRHVDAGPSPGPVSGSSQSHTVIDLPPEYQNARN